LKTNFVCGPRHRTNGRDSARGAEGRCRAEAEDRRHLQQQAARARALLRRNRPLPFSLSLPLSLSLPPPLREKKENKATGFFTRKKPSSLLTCPLSPLQEHLDSISLGRSLCEVPGPRCRHSISRRRSICEGVAFSAGQVLRAPWVEFSAGQVALSFESLPFTSTVFDRHQLGHRTMPALTSISLANNEGGSGKTFLLFQAACDAAHARPERNVLVIDLSLSPTPRFRWAVPAESRGLGWARGSEFSRRWTTSPKTSAPIASCEIWTHIAGPPRRKGAQASSVPYRQRCVGLVVRKRGGS